MTSFSKSGTTASYTYDAFNRRVSKTVNGTTIYYVYNGDDIIEERSSAGALNADWVHGDEIDEPLTMTRGGTTYYYTRDALGSVRELTNSAGTVQETYTYNGYGQPSAAPTINNPFMFTGREYDAESGNYYYRRRYYDPTLGRFMQRDPIGYEDSMNLYKYVSNGPINFIDPFGLQGSYSDRYWSHVNTYFYNPGPHILWILGGPAPKSWFGQPTIWGNRGPGKRSVSPLTAIPRGMGLNWWKGPLTDTAVYIIGPLTMAVVGWDAGVLFWGLIFALDPNYVPVPLFPPKDEDKDRGGCKIVN